MRFCEKKKKKRSKNRPLCNITLCEVGEPPSAIAREEIFRSVEAESHMFMLQLFQPGNSFKKALVKL